MSTTIPAAATVANPRRSEADRAMRRLLFLPVDAPKASLLDGQGAFSTSIAISAARCLITYVLLPVLRPLVDLSGGVGPALGLVVGFVSMVAISYSMRRFFAADHKYRWYYAAIGGAIFALLVVQTVVDLRAALA